MGSQSDSNWLKLVVSNCPGEQDRDCTKAARNCTRFWDGRMAEILRQMKILCYLYKIVWTHGVAGRLYMNPSRVTSSFGIARPLR